MKSTTYDEAHCDLQELDSFNANFNSQNHKLDDYCDANFNSTKRKLESTKRKP